MDGAPEEIVNEQEVEIKNEEENRDSHDAEVDVSLVQRNEVTPTPVTEKPKAKAKGRGRPVGSTSKNTYQALADRLDQMDAKLAEREKQLNARLAERDPQKQQSSRQSGILLQGGPEEAAAHLISQLGLQAEERHRQKLQMYRSFLPP